MHGEGELAKAGCHDHGCCTPGSVTLEDSMCRPGPWGPPTPVKIAVITSRTRMIAIIPDTFTQHGAPG